MTNKQTPKTESSVPLDDLLPLTPLSFHILLALVEEDRHGYGILKEIERQTGGKMKTASGALYLAAIRLTQSGLIEESEERPDPELDDRRRRRYFRLTPLGHQVAAAETERMMQLVNLAVGKRLVTHDHDRGEAP